jgi:hypothetical protein
MKEHRKAWQELYFALSNGQAADAEALKQLDVFEFFSRFEIWEDDLQAKIDAAK